MLYGNLFAMWKSCCFACLLELQPIQVSKQNKKKAAAAATTKSEPEPKTKHKTRKKIVQITQFSPLLLVTVISVGLSVCVWLN